MSAVQYQLLYDADCPLCVWYTGYFKKNGYLQPAEVVPMQQANLQLLPGLHRQKMTNEIPLVNIAQQSVRYGTDAIITIIAKKHPILAKIASWKAFQPFIKTLYSFISYNRKVITGTLPSCSHMTCAPAFHLRYRMAFVVLMQLLMSSVFISGIVTGFDIPFTLHAGWWMLAVSAILSIVFFLSQKQQQLWMEIFGQITMWLLLTSVGGWLLGNVQQYLQKPWLTAIVGTFYFLQLLWPQSKQRWQYVQLQISMYKNK
ncbi:DCC1-like thiol-disulfide oxidoreductase family protein [Phnomibacter sp. MR]|uniref:DCC1-like thiol-disulfide oxidoreductase family protein n=1 Tax=Phnomibacter sp. MR TaxID=3042318 RepID=UPI003A800646